LLKQNYHMAEARAAIFLSWNGFPAVGGLVAMLTGFDFPEGDAPEGVPAT